ncbi:Bifunctional inhibitor/plant lipid transfer protein/seed storage helical domain containing protein [Parasponia andersonii]|uniref:Bifunctional inhibitor/plant lipid transfer protein/seed storage helical domain containing protein n=1 Tax=Parasponia andersonii TaxID=3476 RepID=A0A2P5DCR8_PARAD|nr:Bifunctional inhibitor/plant lipid transfer protein/seed storage helical domain containing protein [Parasponia andersonii]
MRAIAIFSLAGMVMVVAMVAVAPPMVKADLSPSECKQERNQLVNECRPVIFGRNPSANCCQRVRVTHVECVCPYVTPKLANLVNVERSIRQIQGCGRTVPHNFKCGSEFLSLISYHIFVIDI